jgi:hypothetical protein
MFDLSSGNSELFIDGTPHPDHPMTCFGRVNDDIYDNNYNIRFLKDGAIIVIRAIYPGDELLIGYGADYTKKNWDWIKKLALSALIEDLTTRFHFLTDIPPNVSLRELSLSRHPVLVAIKDIIMGDTWTENLHSLTISPELSDPLGLCLFLTSGLTFEKYRFGGWGVDKTFPVVVPKRGQTGFFCDCWNKTSIATIDPNTLLSMDRKNNGAIRELLSNLNKLYLTKAIPPLLRI